MEAWKVILLVAALPLMGAAGLAYMNGQKLKDEIDARIRKEDQVAQAESRKAKLEEEKKKLETAISEKKAEKDDKQGPVLYITWIGYFLGNKAFIGKENVAVLVHPNIKDSL